MDEVMVLTSSGPDLTSDGSESGDLFGHGPCSIEGCGKPSVFEGRLCADHVAEWVLMQQAPRAPVSPTVAASRIARRQAQAREKGKRRAAAASRRRNRR